MQKKKQNRFFNLFRLRRSNRENTTRRQMNWKTDNLVSGLSYFKIAQREWSKIW